MNMPTVWQVLLWMGCFEAEMKHCLRGVKRHPFFVSFLEKVAKRWPKLRHKRKKILWCPEQDLNLHSFRNTHLKRARLPIPPPGHLVEFTLLELGGKKKQPSLLISVPRTRLELAPPYGDYPLKVACLPIPPPGLAISRKRVQKY